MRFKDWLLWSETGTSTGDVAGFSRVAIPLVTRMYTPPVIMDYDEREEDDDDIRKTKRRKKNRRTLDR